MTLATASGLFLSCLGFSPCRPHGPAWREVNLVLMACMHSFLQGRERADRRARKRAQGLFTVDMREARRIPPGGGQQGSVIRHLLLAAGPSPTAMTATRPPPSRFSVTPVLVLARVQVLVLAQSPCCLGAHAAVRMYMSVLTNHNVTAWGGGGGGLSRSRIMAHGNPARGLTSTQALY